MIRHSKFVGCVAFVFMAFSFFSCSSTKNQDSDMESEPAGTPIAIKRPAASEAGEESKPYEGSPYDKGDHYSDEKIKGGYKTLGEQILGTKKYEKYDEVTIYLSSTLGRVITRYGNFIYKPHTDMAGFIVRYDTSLYAFYLAKSERKALRFAVEQYLKDFDERNLDRNQKKPERVYGTVGGYEEFGLVEMQMKNRSKPKVHFGYKFIKKSPFFCIYVVRSDNITDDPDNQCKQSVDQKYYFTKAQAQALAEFLSDENIDAKYTAPKEKPTKDKYNEIFDAYEDKPEEEAEYKEFDSY